MKENPKAFWSFIKKMRQEDTGIADLKVNNKIISDDLGKAEALSEQFASVFTVEDKVHIPTLGVSETPDINKLIIGKEGVLRQINRLKPNKAPGPDGISPWMLQLCAEEITSLDQHLPVICRLGNITNPMERSQHMCNFQERCQKQSGKLQRSISNQRDQQDLGAHNPFAHHETSGEV